MYWFWSFALAGLIANGTIERMIEQKEFDGGLLRRFGFGRERVNDHALRHFGVTADGQHVALGAFDLHHAGTAVPGHRQITQKKKKKNPDSRNAPEEHRIESAASRTFVPSGTSITFPSIVIFAT